MLYKRDSKEEFDGKIEVEIIRDPQQVAEIEGIDKSINEITGFRIIDNGVGLDDNNMKSFCNLILHIEQIKVVRA